jgi:hypothetical protein
VKFINLYGWSVVHPALSCGLMSLDPRSRPGPGFWTRDGGRADETPEAAYVRIDEAARLFLQRLIDMVGQEPIFLRSAGQPEDSVVVFDNLSSHSAFNSIPNSRLSSCSIFRGSWSLATWVATGTQMPFFVCKNGMGSLSKRTLNLAGVRRDES